VSNREKSPLTYTVGDTAFGEALRSVAEQAQKPGENRDKKSGGRHRSSPRKDQNMSQTTQQSQQAVTDVTPAGGPSRARSALDATLTEAKSLGRTGAHVAVGMTTGILVYWGAKSVGIPLP